MLRGWFELAQRLSRSISVQAHDSIYAATCCELESNSNRRQIAIFMSWWAFRLSPVLTHHINTDSKHSYSLYSLRMWFVSQFLLYKFRFMRELPHIDLFHIDNPNLQFIRRENSRAINFGTGRGAGIDTNNAKLRIVSLCNNRCTEKWHCREIHQNCATRGLSNEAKLPTVLQEPSDTFCNEPYTLLYHGYV